jgi:hypothetical protein
MAAAGRGGWLLLDRSAMDRGQQPPSATITTRSSKRHNFFTFLDFAIGG